MNALLFVSFSSHHQVYLIVFAVQWNARMEKLKEAGGQLRKVNILHQFVQTFQLDVHVYVDITCILY